MGRWVSNRISDMSWAGGWAQRGNAGGERKGIWQTCRWHCWGRGIAVWCMWAHGSQLKYQRKMVAPSMENKEPRATGDHVDSHVSCPLGGQVAQDTR